MSILGLVRTISRLGFAVDIIVKRCLFIEWPVNNATV